MRILGQIGKLTDTLGKSATPIFRKCVHVAPVDATINIIELVVIDATSLLEVR